MIESRRKANTAFASPTTVIPLSSGPRCASVRAADSNAASAFAGTDFRNTPPRIPHIGLQTSTGSNVAKVLVTDGTSRTCLAATRALGRAGHEVYVTATRLPALATVSRWSTGSAEV